MNPSIELQRQIKHNAEDLRNFVSDLRDWEEDMKKKDAEMCSSKTESVNKSLPPVRNKSTKRDSNGDLKTSSLGDGKRGPCNYAAWDKFDVEKACEDVDTEPIQEEEHTRVDENMLRDEAIYEKERGNQFVKKGQWKEAVECYSKAIKCYGRDAIFYANRALCYLKLKNYRAAETDCTSALSLDGCYVKALQRRAVARRELGQLHEALDDIQRAIVLEPNNTALTADCYNIERKLAEQSDQNILVPREVTVITECCGSDKEKPILPAKKHTSLGKVSSDKEPEEKTSSSKSTFVTNKKSSVSQASSQKSQCLWPEIPDSVIIDAIHIPPHRRSKQALKRVQIVEAQDNMVIEDPPEKLDIPKAPAIVKEAAHVSESSSAIVSVSPCDITHEKKELPEVLPTVLPPPPKNSVQFLAGWRQLKNNSDLTYQYLKEIPGHKLPQIFQDSLDGNILSQIIEVLAIKFTTYNEPVKEYLEGLSKVRRFRTLTMFLNAGDRKNLTKLFEYCEISEKCLAEDINSLKKEYEL